MSNWIYVTLLSLFLILLLTYRQRKNLTIEGFYNGNNKTFYTSDIYFNDIIRNYFNEKNYKEENSESTYLFHSNVKKCKTCPITNGFVNTSLLGNKKKQYDNLVQWSNSNGKSISYMPTTFSFNNNDQETIESIKTRLNNEQWIMKPENGARQTGIAIIKNGIEMDNALNKHQKYKEWVIQKYIDKPLLYHNKKFHFRVYVLIVKTNTKFKIYLFPKGYMYVADNDYDPNDVTNEEKHITSSCNNKEYPVEYNKYYGNMAYEKNIEPQLKKIVKDTVEATKESLICPNDKLKEGYKCYKMLGYDIIPDENQKCHLMEINSRIIGMASEDKPGNCKSSNPSLQTPEFKTELMNGMLDIILFDKNTNFIELA